MEIRLTEVRQVFQGVLEGRITREAADRWAYSIVQAYEARNLVFVPVEEEEKIWSGVMYLYGIDSKDAPDSYLHTTDDIRKALNEKLGRTSYNQCGKGD